MSYRRILLKLSGEALAGDKGFGIDPETLQGMAASIRDAYELGVQIGLVIGGGNIFRGQEASICADRVSADHMGMLATVINALAIKEELVRQGIPARVLSALEMPRVAQTFVRDHAVAGLNSKEVVIFAAGTGCPYFTTDTAAALRALEIGADVLIKATKVDGVYDRDPIKDKAAVFFPELTYDEALARGVAVMDATAITLCRDSSLEIRVINVKVPGNLKKLLSGESVGSVVRGRNA